MICSKIKKYIFITIIILIVLLIFLGIFILMSRKSDNSNIETNISNTKFDARIYVLTTEQGGRKTPFFNGYRPKFKFYDHDITGLISLPKGIDIVNPGDNLKITVELEDKIEIKVGIKFKIREGGRTVAEGTVTKVY